MLDARTARLRREQAYLRERAVGVTFETGDVGARSILGEVGNQQIDALAARKSTNAAEPCGGWCRSDDLWGYRSKRHGKQGGGL